MEESDKGQYEIVEREWGQYLKLFDTPHTTVKILDFCKANPMLPQKHKHRHEIWMVLEGEIHITLEGELNTYVRGDIIRIHKDMWHSAVGDAIVLEIWMYSCRSPSTEEDIVRKEKGMH
jgi:quercetin dioxygenase-like cupin family protein